MSKKYENLEIIKIVLWSVIITASTAVAVFIYFPIIFNYFLHVHCTCTYNDLWNLFVDFSRPKNWLGIVVVAMYIYLLRQVYVNIRNKYPVIRHFGILFLATLLFFLLATIGFNC